MLSLPQEAIEEFKKLFKAKRGIDLSDDQACQLSEQLIELYLLAAEGLNICQS